jgi:hypothetical protein
MEAGRSNEFDRTALISVSLCKEEEMKRSWFVLGAVALTLASILPDDAFAQRRGFVGARGIGVRGAFVRPGIGVGRWAGVGWRGAGWRGVGWRGVGWRRGWGWPVAAGIGIGYAGYYGSSCLAWNGWRWVNICYGYPYGYW